MEWDDVDQGQLYEAEVDQSMMIDPTFEVPFYLDPDEQDQFADLGWGAVGFTDDPEDYFSPMTLSPSAPDLRPGGAEDMTSNPPLSQLPIPVIKNPDAEAAQMLSNEGLAVFERLRSYQFLVKQALPRIDSSQVDQAVEDMRQFLAQLSLLATPAPVPDDSSLQTSLSPISSAPLPTVTAHPQPSSHHLAPPSLDSHSAFSPSDTPGSPSTPAAASAPALVVDKKAKKRKSDRMEQSEAEESSTSSSARKGQEVTFKFHHETESSLRVKAEEKKMARGQKRFRVMTPGTMKNKIEESQRATLLNQIGLLSPKHPISTTDFERLNILSQNAFGSTRLVKHLKTKKYYALKSVFRSVAFKHDQMQHVDNEKRLMLALSAPYFVKLFGTFSDRQSLHFLFEFVPGGDLLQYIRTAGKFPPSVAKFYLAEIILAIEHLHERQIVFRDLKPENVLLDEDGHIKLTEFGFARHLAPNEKAWTFCGTADYIAPEVIAGVGHDIAVDWWALGVLLFEMAVGFPPFAAADPMAIFENVSNSYRLQYPTFLDTYVVDLLRGLLQPEPSTRLGNMAAGVGQLKAHPWFRTEPAVEWNDFRMRMMPAPIVPKLDSLSQNYPPLQDDGRFRHDPTLEVPSDVEHFFNTF